MKLELFFFVLFFVLFPCSVMVGGKDEERFIIREESDTQSVVILIGLVSRDI